MNAGHVFSEQKAEADQNENNGTDTEVHQVLHQDIAGILCSCKAGFHHCESGPASRIPAQRPIRNQTPNTSPFKTLKISSVIIVPPHFVV